MVELIAFNFCRFRKEDFAKLSIIFAVAFTLASIDASRLYHIIRAQSTLKLYVLFNVGEVLDKLLSSFGLDVLDCLYNAPGIQYFILSFAYTCKRRAQSKASLFLFLVVHSLVLLYQVVTLNVAANTQNNAILTLLVSNQFMEVKSSVFKKFDRENLFQLACADIVERIILLSFGVIIALRNWSQLEWSLTGELWDRVLVPFGMLVGSEIVVDVLKHAFVTKFNAISPNVYAIYSESLISDLVSKDGLDQSPMVARKLGFSSLPLCCLVK